MMGILNRAQKMVKEKVFSKTEIGLKGIGAIIILRVSANTDL